MTDTIMESKEEQRRSEHSPTGRFPYSSYVFLYLHMQLLANLLNISSSSETYKEKWRATLALTHIRQSVFHIRALD